jgi:hypothetical protein
MLLWTFESAYRMTKLYLVLGDSPQHLPDLMPIDRITAEIAA